MIRISRNIDLIIIHDLMFDVDIIIGIDKISAISTFLAAAKHRLRTQKYHR